MADRGYISLRVSSIKEIVPGFVSVVFEDGHGITYKAGQYITLVRFVHGKEYRRSYSITSSPVLNESLSIGVKRIDNGLFSRYLTDDARPGDEILCTGSGGFFTLPAKPELYQRIFCFAAGSGITPVFSLIKTVLHNQPHIQVVLVYSNTSPQRTAYLQELQALQTLHPHSFHLELLFSEVKELSHARLHRELIFEYLEHHRISNTPETVFYICGPENYMRLCTYTLRERGIPPDHIKKEDFIITTPKVIALPGDKETHTITVKRNNTTTTVHQQYPDTILKAAQKQGLVLPYSCEAGRCGSCVAQCTSGTVWHSYNEVLTEEDLAKGLILTCTGHAIDGDVALSY